MTQSCEGLEIIKEWHFFQKDIAIFNNVNRAIIYEIVRLIVRAKKDIIKGYTKRYHFYSEHLDMPSWNRNIFLKLMRAKRFHLVSTTIITLYLFIYLFLWWRFFSRLKMTHVLISIIHSLLGNRNNDMDLVCLLVQNSCCDKIIFCYWILQEWWLWVEKLLGRVWSLVWFAHSSSVEIQTVCCTLLIQCKMIMVQSPPHYPLTENRHQMVSERQNDVSAL